MSSTDTRLLTRGIVSVLVAQSLFGYSFSSFLLFPKFMATQLGANAAQVGEMATVNRVSTMLGLLLAGIAVDRFGRRPFMAIGAALMALASLSFFWVDELGWLVFALRALQGVAFAMTFAAGSTLLVDLAPPERLAQAIGYFGLTMLATNALAPLSVEFMADAVSWKFAFMVAAAGAVGCLLASFFVRDPDRGSQTRGRAPALLEVVLAPKQLRCAIVIAIVGAAFATLFVLHQPFAIELGLERLSGFFIAYTVAAFLVRLGLGHFVDRIGRSRVALGSLALYAIGVTLTVDLETVGLVPLGGLLGLAHGFFYPSFNALAVEGADENERGMIMSVFQAWFTAGGALGTLLLGALVDSIGYRGIFLVMGLATFSACGILALSPEGRSAFRREVTHAREHSGRGK